VLVETDVELVLLDVELVDVLVLVEILVLLDELVLEVDDEVDCEVLVELVDVD
jgi:hypothetical protein